MAVVVLLHLSPQRLSTHDPQPLLACQPLPFTGAGNSSTTFLQQTPCWPPWASATRSWAAARAVAAAGAAEAGVAAAGRRGVAQVQSLRTRGRQHKGVRLLSHHPSGRKLQKVVAATLSRRQPLVPTTTLPLWMGWVPRLICRQRQQWRQQQVQQ